MQFAKSEVKQWMLAISSIGIAGLFLAWCSSAVATTYNMTPDSDVVGQLQYAQAQEGEDLGDIGRRFGVGTYEMIEANPGVDFYLPQKAEKIVVPTRIILPPGPRKGVVINLAEMRIYYFYPDGQKVNTYPIGIGQDGWSTPTGTNRIIRKRKDPIWIPPESIREKYESHGKDLPAQIPAGPQNPLGPYALTTGFENIVIHGTPWPKGVGVRSSHGCIRMNNNDVTELYQLVEVNTPVRIIHQSVKVGKNGDNLYLEAHVPVDEEDYVETYTIQQQLQEMMNRHNNEKVSVRWDIVDELRAKNLGYPEPFGQVN